MPPAQTVGSPTRSLIVIMGISGCGKSTIGAALARQNNWRFLEGDDFHLPNNIKKWHPAQG
jgi:gluconokinase